MPDLEREKRIALEHLELVRDEKERLVLEARISEIERIIRDGKDPTIQDSKKGSS